MIRMYQEHWFDIEFRSFASLSTSRIADEAFYSAFYKAFYERYGSWDDLPESYRRNKYGVADAIIEQAGADRRVLSIGCGNGIVEHRIATTSNIEVTAMEPAGVACRWLQDTPGVEVIAGFFPEALPGDAHFDFAYGTAIDYVFDDEAYVRFLKSIVDRGIGTFVMHQVTEYDPSARWNRCKFLVKRMLAYAGLYDIGQFWGYMRTMDEQAQRFREAGFSHVTTGRLDRGAGWIMGQVR